MRTTPSASLLPVRRVANFREFVKMLVPFSGMFIALGLHMGLPNIYPDGYVSSFYPTFLVVCMLAYATIMAIGCFVPPLRKRILHSSYLIAGFFMLFALWDMLTLKTGTLLLPFMPSPDKVLAVVPQNAESIVQNLCASMLLLGEGVAIGIVTGMLSGLLIGWSRFADYWFSPILKIIGPVPSAAWLPIAVAIMPSAHAAGVFLISLAVWFPLTLMLSSALRRTDARKIEAARVLGASEPYILFHVALPSAIPSVFTGLFMGLSASFGALIISEQLGVKAGLGWYINWASSWAEYAKVFASVGLFIIIFYTLINILFKIRDHVMRWQKPIVRW